MYTRRKTDSVAAGDRSSPSSPADARVEATDFTGSRRDAAGVVPPWDPYEVWLTRVKQPRDRSRRAKLVSEPSRAADEGAGRGTVGPLAPSLSR